jgi:hypothetical protein
VARVSNKDLAKILDAVQRTAGFTVEYRRTRAKVTGPDGRSEFLRIGSSAFHARDVERQLRNLGWPPEIVAAAPKPPPPPLALPRPPVIVVTEPEPPAPAREDPEPMATLKPAPRRSLKDEVSAKALRFFMDHPGDTFDLEEVAYTLGYGDNRSAISAISSVWRSATHGDPWLHVHRTKSRPQRYRYLHEPTREPWLPKALRDQPAPVVAANPGVEVLAELADGDLLLRTPDGRIWRAAPLGTKPKEDLDD